MIGCLLLSYKLPFFSLLFKVYHVWNFWQNVWEMCGTSIIEKYIYIYWSYKWANIHVKGRYVYKCHYSFFFLQKCLIFFFFGNKDTKCWQMEKYKTSAKLGFWEPDLAIVLEVREAKAFVFECANSLKKLNGFYFYLLLECFE